MLESRAGMGLGLIVTLVRTAISQKVSLIASATGIIIGS